MPREMTIKAARRKEAAPVRLVPFRGAWVYPVVASRERP